ncbi:hypothetical protein NC652_027387 [Populus alba x Populus x berolinensis]|nr:hypothetical protein NC652_027387 [Populus alba x Populus x berolinensis]
MGLKSFNTHVSKGFKLAVQAAGFGKSFCSPVFLTFSLSFQECLATGLKLNLPSTRSCFKLMFLFCHYDFFDLIMHLVVVKEKYPENE